MADKNKENFQLIKSLDSLKPGDHLCQIYQTEEEHRDLLLPFLLNGLTQKEKILHIVDEHTAEHILGYLREAGIDPKKYVDSGQLSILTCDDAYMKQGFFEPDFMINMLRSETDKAIKEGYAALRVTGEMTWALRKLPGSEKLIEYEAKLNNFIAGSKAKVICQYNRRRFDADTLLNVLKTHPIAVIGTEIYDNPFYIPPEEYFSAQPSESQLNHWLKNLAGRKQTEADLHLHTEIIHNIPEGVILSRVSDAVIAYINPKFEKMFGYGPGELIGKNISVVNGPTDKSPQEVAAEIQNCLREKGVWQGEVCNIKKDGTPFWCYASVSTFSHYEYGEVWVAVHTDITERRRAEEALRESEEKYRELVQNANSIILKADMTGRITFFNEFAQRFFSYAEDEIVGKNLVGTIVHKTDAAGRDLEAMIHDIVVHPDNYVSNENENVRRDGARVWISWTNKAILDREGRPIGIICIGNDVTERKRKEEQLLHMQRIEVVGTLTGGIAHDFNNILAGLMGYTSLMKMSIKKGSPLLSDLDSIEKLLQRGASLSGKLLEFSRRRAYRPGPININLVIKDVLGVLAQTAGKRIDMVTELSPRIPSVMGDESEIHQVIINICLNACEAMRGRGTLTVKTADLRNDVRSLQGSPELKEGRYVSVAISDTGIGIDSGEMEHIFEPFYTTKAKKSGTGLGLPVVKSIVEKQGGSITVESVPLKGSTFTVYFPSSAERTSKGKSAAAKRLGGDETILIVDDEKDFRESVGRWLKDLGYVVLEVASGEEAVRMVEGGKVKIDLVILDMVMKGMGGAQAFKRIRESARALPVIICTGYVQDRSRRHILEKEASDFLRKPFTLSELSPRIRKILDGRLL